MSERLVGMNTVITGGGAGIGLATARLFGREGARVAIMDLDGERAGRVESELRSEGIDATAAWSTTPASQSLPISRKPP
jgi:NAD(P)-dependent dehydrogenase (short-subunit alcohol dehydrogenase family)